MRSTLIPLLGLAFVLGCDQTSPLSPEQTSSLGPVETGPAAVKHHIIHTDDRGTFELRGLQGCFGELVIVTGTIRIKEHTMTSTTTGNQDHFSLTFISNGTAVGQETGRQWRFKEISRIRFNTPNLAAPHGNETNTLTTHLIRRGESVKIKIAFHVVINGKGVVKVVVDSFKGPCEPT